jgi:hypothetical protein
MGCGDRLRELTKYSVASTTADDAYPDQKTVGYLNGRESSTDVFLETDLEKHTYPSS